MKRKHLIAVLLMACLCLPLTAQASTLGTHVERAVAQAVTGSQTPKYYIPLMQLPEEKATPGADGPEAGIYWVEIGGTYTADGYEPEFFYLTSKKTVVETYDGPVGPGLEEIVPAIFNEAYRRFAADPKSAKATLARTRQMLTKYYRQVQAEQTAQKDDPAK